MFDDGFDITAQMNANFATVVVRCMSIAKEPDILTPVTFPKSFHRWKDVFTDELLVSPFPVRLKHDCGSVEHGSLYRVDQKGFSIGSLGNL